QEGGLEGVLSIVRIPEHAATHTQDHRPVQPHQGLEGSLVPPGDKALQQLSLRHPAAVAQKGGPAKLLEDAARLIGRHVTRSVARQPCLLLILGEPGRRRRFFPEIPLEREKKEPADQRGLRARISADQNRKRSETRRTAEGHLPAHPPGCYPRRS